MRSGGFENEFKIKNMGYSIRIPNGIISMVDVDFNELKKPTLKIDYPINKDLKDFILDFTIIYI